MRNLHKLLIGRWKSDKRLTLENCHKYHRLTGAKKRNFGSLFGRLVLRYTPSRLHISLPASQWIAKYDVVGVDSESIVIRIHSDDLWKKASPITADIVKQMAEPRFQHITFRRRNGRQYYWIGFGILCEWFRRIGIQQTGSRQGRVRATVTKRKPLARRS